MTIRSSINTFIIFNAIAFFFELVFTFGNDLYGVSTFFLLIFLLFIIFLFNNYDGISDALKILFLILIFLWIIFRIHILLLLPETFSFSNILILNTSNLNFTIILITICIVVMLSGIRMGEIINNSLENKRIHSKPYKFLGGINSIFIVLVFFFILSLIINYITVYSFASGRGGGAPYLLAILSRVLNRGFIFILLSSFVISNWNTLSNRYKVTSIFILLLQISSLIFINASKGAIFWTSFWILICFLASKFNVSKVKISKKLYIWALPVILF